MLLIGVNPNKILAELAPVQALGRTIGMKRASPDVAMPSSAAPATPSSRAVPGFPGRRDTRGPSVLNSAASAGSGRRYIVSSPISPDRSRRSRCASSRERSPIRACAKRREAVVVGDLVGETDFGQHGVVGERGASEGGIPGLPSPSPDRNRVAHRTAPPVRSSATSIVPLGHIVPSSRWAVCSNANVPYRTLNFEAG